jgi:hypothetical protein
MHVDLIQQAREKGHILYEGKLVPHYSCGICIAETFELPTRAFQALRKGGVTGDGECGAIVAGRLVLGYFLGDPDPAGPLRPRLLEAMEYYETLWKAQTEPGQVDDIRCNALVGHLAGDFWGEERMGYCTLLASQIAGCVAQTLVKSSTEFEISPISRVSAESS